MMSIERIQEVNHLVHSYLKLFNMELGMPMSAYDRIQRGERLPTASGRFNKAVTLRSIEIRSRLMGGRLN